MNKIIFGDNLQALQELQDECIDLIYIDPPFNTGRQQKRTRIKTVRSESGDRIGFSGQRYATTSLGSQEYTDIFDDYLAFLKPRLLEAFRVLKADGTIYFHIDYREVHYCKILLDQVFGRDSFLMKSSGLTITGLAQRRNGLLSMTISWFM